MSETSHAPLPVEVLRGEWVESRHLVDAVVVGWDQDGPVVQESWGEPEGEMMPRSAAKPLQALPLVRSGAADAFGLDDVELALACASHNGERAQTQRVDNWLNRIGFSVADLECGAQRPQRDEDKAELWASGGKADPVHNNCSGKHAGFLTVCRHLGLSHVGYIEPDHGLQRDHVTPAMEELCGVSLSDTSPGIDGCGIPVWPMPLSALASGWLRLANDQSGRRLLQAMVDQPYFVAGTGRACTRIMTDATAPVAVKVGAEGVYGAVLLGPDGDRAGPAVALKVRDGATRAAEVAVEWLLERLGVFSPGPNRLTNHFGTEVGRLRIQA